MTRNPISQLTLLLPLDPTSPTPLYQQLYHGLRHAILSGQLSADTRLPSTRTLAHSLSLSRSTVFTAFEQLLSEGYIYGKVGSGTYVAHTLPDELLNLPATPHNPPPAPPQSRRLSQRGIILATTQVTPTHYWREIPGKAFRPGLPAIDLFPAQIWSRLTSHHWRHLQPDQLSYAHPAGYQPLRAQIAAYVQAARGVRCREEQVIITAGAQQGLDLTARLLLDPGDPVCIEDPCYLGTRAALLAAQVNLIPCPVDAEGLDVATAKAHCPTPRLICVTPSHQFPLGVTMTLLRRLALLQWANQADAWIIEDDYDSEYRYTGRPLSSLQGLDTTNRVIYLGTFSKVLFPGLRLGYLVVPPDLIDAFTAARALVDRQPPILEQLILTDFMEQEHFARHLRRMRTIYAERQATLVTAITTHLSDHLTIQPAEIGMHLVAHLSPDFVTRCTPNLDDTTLFHHLTHHNIIAPPLSHYYLTPSHRPGLILGYTALTPTEIESAVHRLATALQSLPIEP